MGNLQNCRQLFRAQISAYKACKMLNGMFQSHIFLNMFKSSISL